jgi:hypothetical protein
MVDLCILLSIPFTFGVIYVPHSQLPCNGTNFNSRYFLNITRLDPLYDTRCANREIDFELRSLTTQRI